MDERGTIDGGRTAGGPNIAPEDAAAADPEGKREDRKVGLGRVVEDHLSSGSPDPDDPGEPDAPERMRDVTPESEQSFPASDPPGFIRTKAAEHAEER